MFLIPIILAWAKNIPLKDWLYAGALAIAVGGIIYWNYHEREIGKADIEAHDAAVQQAAQAAIDKNAAETNAKLQAAYNASVYVPTNYSPAVDCGSVPANVRLSVNGAGKTSKH